MLLVSLAAVGWALAASLALFAELAVVDSRFAAHCSYGYYTAHSSINRLYDRNIKG